MIIGRSHTHFLRLPLQIYHFAGSDLILGSGDPEFRTYRMLHFQGGLWRVIGLLVTSLLHFSSWGFLG